MDDIVVVNGRSIQGALMDAALERRLENDGAAAIGLSDGRFAVAVEARLARSTKGIDQKIAGALAATFGVRPELIVVLSGGGLDRTSSGKLRRRAVATRAARQVGDPG